MALPILLKAGSFFSGTLAKFALPALSAVPVFFKNGIQSKEVKKYAPWITAIGIGAYIVYRFRLKSLKLTVDEVRGKNGKANRLAILIAQHLGTNKNLKWYQISSWSEDEEEVLQILEENQDMLKEIINAYDKISKSGDFISDIQSLFNASQITRFNKLFI